MTQQGTSQTLASILGLTKGLHSLMSFCTAWPEIQNVCQKSRVVMTRPLPMVVGIVCCMWNTAIDARSSGSTGSKWHTQPHSQWQPKF